MRIGICFEGRNLSGIDYSEPNKGNPGVGGTTYLELLLGYYLSLKENYEVIMYTMAPQTFPSELKQIVVKNDLESITQAESDQIDIFIFVAGRKKQEFYENLRKSKLKAIAWAHNYLDFVTIKELKRTNQVKRVVFVGQQLYDSYIDDGIIMKSSYIFNMVPPVNEQFKKSKTGELGVTYIGALVPVKGFHKLAKEWRFISKSVPNAKLFVIGSGKLYNHNVRLGTMGIAEEKYEKKIVKYLSDKEGNLLPNVFFCGQLGNEKYDIFARTAVGVPNPTGKSETFCLSAVEMEQLSIPIVTYRGYGLLDTVIDGENGILIKGGKQLRKAIVSLLENDSNREILGLRSKTVSSQFEPDIIIKNWYLLLNDVFMDKKAINMFSKTNYWDDMKWFKFFMYIIKRKVNFENTYGLNYYISCLKCNIKNISKRKWLLRD